MGAASTTEIFLGAAIILVALGLWIDSMFLSFQLHQINAKFERLEAEARQQEQELLQDPIWQQRRQGPFN